MTGRNELAPGFAVTVSREGEILFLQATGQPRRRVFAFPPTRFFLGVVDAELVFQANASGEVTGITLYQAGQELPGKRVSE